MSGTPRSVVGRPDALHDENLRALYREDPDWNVVIRDLSEERLRQRKQQLSSMAASTMPHWSWLRTTLGRRCRRLSTAPSAQSGILRPR